jgi:hypothetical protein
MEEDLNISMEEDLNISMEEVEMENEHGVVFHITYLIMMMMV